MNETYLKIDDVAQQTGLSKRTLLYYEEIGIIPPSERSNGGVRLYSPTIIKRLNDIVRAKDVLGLTLQELQEFLSLRELLDNQRTEYRASTNDLIKQEKLQEIIDIINNQLNMIEQKKENMQQVEQELLDLRERGLTLFNKKGDDKNE